jgi:hypothetical protein
MSIKDPSDTIGNQTRDLPSYSAVPQPTAPPRAPGTVKVKYLMHVQSKTLQFQVLLKMRTSRSPGTHAINPAITRTAIQFIDDGLSTAKLTLWDERIRGNELSLPKMDTQESKQQH